MPSVVTGRDLGLGRDLGPVPRIRRGRRCLEGHGSCGRTNQFSDLVEFSRNNVHHDNGDVVGSASGQAGLNESIRDVVGRALF